MEESFIGGGRDKNGAIVSNGPGFKGVLIVAYKCLIGILAPNISETSRDMSEGMEEVEDGNNVYGQESFSILTELR